MNLPLILQYLQERGYEIFSDDIFPYNLNIVGRRRIHSRVNHFDDILEIYWLYHGQWQSRSYTITTLPGLPWLLKPFTKKGTAVLAAGQYRDAYTIGRFKGRYPALIQVKPVSVYRDANLDDLINKDASTLETGYFGIDIHKAGILTPLVGLSSAGCQVFQKEQDFNDFMSLCNAASHFWGSTFTYTLIEE